jgi:uncharacterized protein (DUF2236 family)
MVDLKPRMRPLSSRPRLVRDDASMLQRVHSEGILLLGGGRALLLQIAHPAVAAGVAEHSSYRRRKLDRLLRTLRSTYTLIFGTPSQVKQASQRINAIHAGVNGAGYRAADPELLLWVYATLVDTTLLIHERFLGRLCPQDAEAYYQEARQLARLMGLPPHMMPLDLASHRRYFTATLDTLVVSPAAKSIAAELLRPLPGLEAPMWLARQVTAGLLPSRLRADFGLTWNTNREAALQAFAALSRGVLPRLPRRLRAPPSFLLP